MELDLPQSPVLEQVQRPGNRLLGRRAARFALLGSALLFSTGGAAVKFISLSPAAVACSRSALAFLFLMLVVPKARRRPSGGGELLVSLAFAATMLLFVLASRATTAANAVFLQASAPLYLLLLGPLVLGEALRRRNLWTLLGMALGLGIFFAAPGESQSSAPNPGLGNLLGALTGMTWALSILGLRWLESRGQNTLSTVAFGNLFCVLLALPLLEYGGDGSWLPSAADAGALLWLGCFQIGCAYLLVSMALKRVPAFEASLLFLVEPVFNPVWTWMMHGEVPGTLPLVGGALILACALHASAGKPQSSS